MYGIEVAEMVSAVSGEGNSRSERTKDTIQKLNVCNSAIDVKIIDRYCNMLCARQGRKEKLMKMYYSEVPLYEDLFKKANPAFQLLFNVELSEYKKVFEPNESIIKLKMN